MKRYFFFAIMFVCLSGLAQVQPKQELVQDYFYYDRDTFPTGWKYHAGDDIKWADHDFNDQDWEQGKFESMDIYDFIKSHPTHLGWFRLRIKMADSLSNKHKMMTFYALGACEVYLNGQLVKAFGRIDTDPNKVEAVNMLATPFFFNLSEDSIQVIAVRFAYPSQYYYSMGNAEVIHAYIGGDLAFDSSISGYRPPYLIFTPIFVAGLFLMLSVLHVGFFYFYQKGTQNLYYSIYTLLNSIGWFLTPIIILYVAETELCNWLNIFLRFNYFFNTVFFLLTIREYFQYQKKGTLYFLLLLSSITFVLYLVIKDQIINGPLFFVVLFYHAEALRITFIKGEANINGTRLIRTGIISYFVLWFIGLTLMLSFQYEPSMYFQAASIAINALMMSWAIARKVGDTNVELQKMLIEVEELSKEKQDILTRQNIELEEKVVERTRELKDSLNHLKSTQSQLIQSEKMSSLGELTAGIAHEIQNPLNFVNNFSEVSNELIDEMNEELDKGDIEEAKTIASDIKQNLEKINHHGKRADAIVKGMLQHSRSSTGVKEPTDINALADEYLRLAYHGLRAKDKSFNANMKTDFDETIGNINIIPQDIGRVILNLITNAFYAVNIRKTATVETRHALSLQQTPTDYKPTVTVSTAFQKPPSGGRGAFVLISVRDNGYGIPAHIVDKIFQPFFTTKPTGQGTGLGLSLAYDIVKAHGGELKVETKEGEGTEFIIELPNS